jgi:uncharacterized protein YhaN
MKLRRISIDGYGRLVGREMEFHPGLQALVGPNEQGKSTIRAFIADMLYGQKRSAAQRVYEDSNELRCPWTDPDKYGGRLIYELEDGRVIEVYRRFDKKFEQVQVFDQTHGVEITGQFEQLRNREPNFAQAHLGISKEIFTNTITIGNLGLEGLGDDAALAQIREKLLTLADSGEEASSADAAIKHIEARIALIGPPASRTRPLPAARNRLAELDQEMAAARALRAELEQTEARRRSIQDEIAALRAEASALDKELETVARLDRAQRLKDAATLEEQIAELTRKCFSLREAAQFPLEQRHDFQRTEMLLTTAGNTLRRLRQERDQRELNVNKDGQADSRIAINGDDVPEEIDQQLASVEERIKALRVRLDEATTARDAAAVRLSTAEQELASLPDFNRIAEDPVTWLGQLAGSFRVAQRHRDDAVDKRRALREKLERQRGALSDSDKLFTEFPDFESAVREYEVQKRMREEQTAQLEEAMESLKAEAQEWTARLPGFLGLTLLTTVILAALIGAFFLLANKGILVAAAMTGLAMLYFLGKLLYGRSQRSRALTELDDAESRIVHLNAAGDGKNAAIENVMMAADCQTVRELEAKFDFYRKARIELEAAMEASQDVEQKAADAEQRVDQLLETYKKLFSAVGEPITGEDDVEAAASRAAAKYQAYRDAKRRVAENRDLVKRHDGDISALLSELDECREENVRIGLEARQLMRDFGFADENKHDTALGALRSYRIRSAQLREKRRTLAQALGDLDLNIEAEEKTVRQHQESIEAFLKEARVDSIEAWHERARQAETYRDIRQKLETCNDKLAVVLRGQDLRELRAAVAADEESAEAAQSLEDAPAHSPEQHKKLREDYAARIEALNKEEHALHVALAEKQAGARTLCEIHEEHAALTRQVRELDAELNAAVYAKAMIENIARDKHSRIAPKLALRAGDYIERITSGKYNELTVSRELKISIRLPQTQKMQEEPERVLSKGTTDQIYLALRLAMTQCIAEKGEPLPMLLDDPFPNYDDERLRKAMSLLAEIAETTQILLFTCRDDVIEAAQSAGAPIITI